MAQSNKRQIQAIYPNSFMNTMGVIKIKVGEKYLIWKGKLISRNIVRLEDDIDRLMENGNHNKEHLLSKLVDHMLAVGATTFEVESVLETDSPLEMLVTEFDIINIALYKKDPYCLNVTQYVPVPKWIPEEIESEFSMHVCLES